MSRVSFRKGEDNKRGAPGTWHFLDLRTTPPSRAVVIHCPSCGKHGTIHQPGDPDRHTIDEHGNVHPSLVCPHGGCQFHEWGKLEGWTGGALT